MSDLLGLAISMIVASLALTAALALRLRGTRRLIRGVDWRRVSDSAGLVHYTSLVMLAVAGLIAAGGALRFALRADPALQHAVNSTLSVVFVVLMLALLLIKARFQDLPKSDLGKPDSIRHDSIRHDSISPDSIRHALNRADGKR
jgi:hypothetical protein